MWSMKCGSPMAAKVPRSLGLQVLAQHAQPAHMGLVDHRVGPRHVGWPVVGPVEAVVGDDGLQHARRAVAAIEGEVAARRVHPIAVERIGRTQFAGDALGIGIEQELVMVEAMAVLRLVGPVGAIAVDQAGARIGHVAVPDLVGAFRQLEAHDLAPARRIEDAELDLGGMGGEHREVGAEPVPGGAQRIGRAAEQAIGPRHLSPPRAASPWRAAAGSAARTGPRRARAGRWATAPPSLPRSLPP